MPAAVRAVVERIGENCEPSLCTRAVHGRRRRIAARRRHRESGAADALGGRPARRASPWAARRCYVWPGGGITVMVDVTRMPKAAFGYVPTPAIVAPIEFTLPRALYERLGGHAGDIVSIDAVIRDLAGSARIDAWQGDNPWPFARKER